MFPRICTCVSGRYGGTKLILNWGIKMQSNHKEFKIRSWDDTVASKCRWSEYAEELIGGWAILWENSDADWQGCGRVLAFKQGQLRYLEWYYGSCSGCDAYEDMKEEDIRKEFQNNVMMHFKDVDTFCNWMKMLAETKDSKFEEFCEAISSTFKNENTKWLEDPDRLHDKINVLSLLKD